MIETVRELKKRYTIDVIAGNVATAEGAKALADAGADAVKVGIGPGSICTTRIISGRRRAADVGDRQRGQGADGDRRPVIADGGIRYSGDITKALAAGAALRHARRPVRRPGREPGADDHLQGAELQDLPRHGVARGDGGRLRATATSQGGREPANGKLVPEGVEGRVPYKGQLAPFVYQLVGGLRAGMGYCGTRNIEELRTQGPVHPGDRGVGAGEPSA